MLDAFFLSHTSEPVDIPDAELVDRFLPPRQARYRLDVHDPHAYGALVRPDDFLEMRWHLQDAMRRTLPAFVRVEEEFRALFGRGSGAIEEYRATDARLILVTSGTITSTAREVVDGLRDRGERVGLVKVRMFRPFPAAELCAVLRGADKVAVLDRNLSPGAGGIFAQETRSALFDLAVEDRPMLYGYVVGIGGRDVTPEVIEEIVERTEAAGVPERADLWVGVHA
jgi:pyruvate ferredoxin oxidoreductase alpha subunit